MVLKRSLIVLMVASVAGCAWNTIQPAMDGLVGKHIDEAIRYLGFPNEDVILAGHRVVSWYVQDSMPIPHTSSVTNSYTGTSVVMTSYSMANVACQLRVEVDADLIIRTWEGNGDEGACARFASRLSAAPRYVKTGTKGAEYNCATSPDRWSKSCLLRKTD